MPPLSGDPLITPSRTLAQVQTPAQCFSRLHPAGKARLGVQFVNVEPTQRDHWWKIMRSDF